MKKNSYIKSYKSDIYIMIPYTSTNIIMNCFENKENDICKEYLKYMNENSKNECSDDISRYLKRYYLGQKKLCVQKNDNTNEYEIEEVNLYLTINEPTGICLLTIMDLNSNFSPTHIQDQAIIDKLYIKENNSIVTIDKYLNSKYNLNRSGEAKILLSLSNKPENNLEFQYMLASERYDNLEEYKLSSKEIMANSKQNFSQYDFYEIYASKSSVVYILKDFDYNSIMNIQEEALILFIMELILFQNAAVLRTNKKIVESLANDGKVTLDFIESLYIEFGKTIKFWGKDVFKYVTAQILFIKINESFATKDILEDYYTNQKFLEHIVNLRDVQNSNRESKILNLIVLVLTILQVIPILISFVNWIKNIPNNVASNVMFQFIGLSSLSLLFVVILIKNNKEKKKKRSNEE